MKLKFYPPILQATAVYAEYPLANLFGTSNYFFSIALSTPENTFEEVGDSLRKSNTTSTILPFKTHNNLIRA